jgi:D-lactate dehydrogenase (cytochrome)
LLDEVQIRVSNVHSKTTMAEEPTLFVEFIGTDASVAEQAERFGEIVADNGGSPFEWATRLEDRNRLWQVRHEAFWGQRSYRPGAQVLVTDVCVPVSRLAECVTATKEDIERTGLLAPILGHLGDGNFHASMMVMMDDPGEVARAKAFAERLAERALAMEGTCTGEHGIGEGKKHFLVPEHGQAAVDAMRAIKQALDPKGIMNPGKIV